MGTDHRIRRGFTLVEILIVVIILGILAALVIPQFANASQDARTQSLRTSLANVRNQIEIFKAEHSETSPALAGMWTLLTSKSGTTEFNSPAPTGTRWGPYLMSVPVNPMNGMTGISSAANDPTAGWYYQPAGMGFTFYARNADGSINTSY